ncbi:MAG: apolipoprotein N-acyltransferase [Acidimicrobiia bacterium]
MLLTATLPPFDLWWLGPVGVAVLVAVLPGLGWRGRALVGFAAGLGWFVPGLWWVTQFHAAGWVAIVLTESALMALGMAAVPRGAVAVGLPAALVLVEAVRGRWPFGGLPLAGLDIGQADGPLLAAARIGGHLLLVALVGLAGVGLAALVRRRWVAGVACLGATVAVAGAGALAPDGSATGTTLAVAAVQGGGPRGLRAVDSDERLVLERHVAASAEVPVGTDLVLWPEDVVDTPGPYAGSAAERAVQETVRRLGTTVVVGVVEDVGGGDRFRNAAIAYDPHGRQVDRYDKVHRVPFGEYIPFRSLLDRVADVSAVPRDAIAGTGPGVLDTPAGRMAVAISFEVFFADRARSGVEAGGRLLLVPTNASSFTTSQVPAQEVAVARLRAVETGRSVVQAAPTGYSAVIDHRGRVAAQGPLGAQAVVTGVVGMRTGRTLALVLGDWPVVVVAVGGVVVARKLSRQDLGMLPEGERLE